MFSRNHRLTDSDTIQTLTHKGQRFTSANLRIYWRPAPTARFTVVVSKKTARLAITRNKMKRRVRAALESTPLPKTVEVVVFPKVATQSMPFTEIQQELTGWVHKIS